MPGPVRWWASAIPNESRGFDRPNWDNGGWREPARDPYLEGREQRARERRERRNARTRPRRA